MTDETTFIYALVDPLDGRVRYVGKADDPVARLKRHWKTYKDGKTGNWWLRWWFRLLDRRGEQPGLDILLAVPKENWQWWERSVIAHFRSVFGPLCNLEDGGMGGAWNRGKHGFMRHSSETRARLAAVRATPEARHAQSLRTKAQWARMTEEERKNMARGAARPKKQDTRKRLSVAKIGRSLSKAHKDAISAGHAWKGKKRPEQSAAMLAHYSNPAARAETGEASRRAWQDPKLRQAARERRLGWKHSALTKRRIRVGHIIHQMRRELYGTSNQ